MRDRTPQLDQVWDTASAFAGWLTDEQARLLWKSTVELPDGAHVVEIGSHQGRSTAVLAAATAGHDVRLTAIDPHETGFGPGHDAAKAGFETNLDRVGLRHRVELIEEFSHHVLPTWSSPIDVLYIDGAHDYRSVLRDLRWVRWVEPRGVVLVHDAFSSVGVTLAFVTHVIGGRSLRYQGRAGSLAWFTVEPPAVRHRLAMVRQLPWFVRNIAIKVVMVCGQHRLARALGHDQGKDFPF